MTSPEELKEWGSGWKIEAEREYKEKGEPLYYHLFMYGLWWPTGYELVGKNLERLIKKAVADGKKKRDSFRKNIKKYYGK